MLSTHQIGLRIRNSRYARTTVKHCGTCGGKHAGECQFVSTRHGTRCREDILHIVEARAQERNR